MTALDNARRTYVWNVMGITVLSVALFLLAYIGFLRKEWSHLSLPLLEAQRFAEDNVARLDLLAQIRKRTRSAPWHAGLSERWKRILYNTWKTSPPSPRKRNVLGGTECGHPDPSGYAASDLPPLPERDEFDIYATMTPAREVGGDFYDFFLVDQDHLAVVIADVSGKGVPAALFMVIAKTPH